MVEEDEGEPFGRIETMLISSRRPYHFTKTRVKVTARGPRDICNTKTRVKLACGPRDICNTKTRVKLTARGPRGICNTKNQSGPVILKPESSWHVAPETSVILKPESS